MSNNNEESSGFTLINDEWLDAALPPDDYIQACQDFNRSTLNWGLTHPDLRPHILSSFPSINTYAQAQEHHGPFWIHIKNLYSNLVFCIITIQIYQGLAHVGNQGIT